MKKTIAALILAVVATPVVAADAVQTAPTSAVAVATKGKMLVSADGARLATIYRVTPAGADLIVDGHMVTVPADTISLVDGKITTSLSKSQVIAIR